MIDEAREDREPNLTLWKHGAIYLLAFAVLVAHRPEAIFHSQFFAEDGHVWFADAYNLGWGALFQAHTGYFQTFPRLGAELALLWPLSLAPLILNVINLSVTALPVNILLDSRSSRLGDLRFRAALATMYLFMPNCVELRFGIVESQWLLSLNALLVVVALPPRGLRGSGFDMSLVVLCGLTGPFCIFLLPIAVCLAWKRGKGGRWSIAGALAAFSLIQAWALLILDPTGRARAVLGAGPALFVRLLGGQVYLGALIGSNLLASKQSLGLIVLFTGLAVGGTILVAFHFAQAGLEMRLLLLYSALLLTASLISPTGSVPAGTSYWEHLTNTPGVRYWFFPTLAFAWTLLWGVHQSNLILKRTCALLLCIMCIGVIRDFRHHAIPDMHFAEFVKRFEVAPVGTTVTFPLYPEGWNMQLVKHPSQ